MLQKDGLEELFPILQKLKKELLNLRFQLATGNLENTAEIKSIKVNIAILKTALNDKK